MNEFMKDYMEKMNYGDDMIIITWPASHKYMREKWFNGKIHLINDDIGIKLFGLGACVIPKNKA